MLLCCGEGMDCWNLERMSMAIFFNQHNIDNALKSVKRPGSFDFRSFSVMIGFPGLPVADAKKVFKILDRDSSGFIEEDELPLFLKFFSPHARDLTAAEVKTMMKAFHAKNGKITMDGRHFQECGHAVGELRWCILEKVCLQEGVDPQTSLLRRESTWIYDLGTLAPNGMNEAYNLKCFL
ncbi:parvalbumin beta-like [Hyperolius riggenbachi]|uniref:parvalbumin beta-like n=1 Tax=Hyperolius riggenbachi TaxID=752182 RepID=UPI0035A375A3